MCIVEHCQTPVTCLLQAVSDHLHPVHDRGDAGGAGRRAPRHC